MEEHVDYLKHNRTFIKARKNSMQLYAIMDNYEMRSWNVSAKLMNLFYNL